MTVRRPRQDSALHQGRRRGRVAVGSLLVALPMVAAGVVVGAGPASAAVSAFPAGAYTSNTTISIQASASRSATQSTLTLVDPTGATKQVAVTTAKDVFGQYTATTLSYSLTTTCEQASTNSCSGDHPALNGTWVVKVVGDAANTDTKQFRIDIAPRIPTGVAATGTGPSQITVTWQPDTEPDLQQYDVLDGAGHGLRTLTAASCSDTCSSVFDYPSTASGDRSFAVSATRSAPAESSGLLSSPASSSQSATLAGPDPSPAPTAGPSNGPSNGPSAGPSPGPGSGAGASPGGKPSGAGKGGAAGSGSQPAGGAGNASQGGPAADAAGPQAADPGQRAAEAALAARTSFAESFTSFAPSIGLNKLPPLPVNEGPILAEGELPDGTYQPTLGYTDKIVQEPLIATRATVRASGALQQVLDPAELARALAVTLLLVLGGLHLRRWAASGVQG